MEIERKWLVSGFPTGKIIKEETIYQGYLSVNPEVRLKKNVPLNGDPIRYYICYKSNGDLSRIENEEQIEVNTYNELFNYIEAPMIKKDYKVFDVDGVHLEVAEVDNEWFYSEVEFETEEEANKYSFPIPKLVEYEATHLPQFKMKAYWERTRGKSKLPKILMESQFIQNLINNK